jgi:hypothetical protein
MHEGNDAFSIKERIGYSPIFSASVVVDATPPVAEPVGLSSGTTCSKDSLVALRVAGADPCASDACAGLYQMQISTDGALDTEAWVDFDTQYAVDLGTDGTKNTLVAL